MTEHGNSKEHISVVWQRYLAKQEAQKPTEPLAERWQQIKENAQQTYIEKPTDLSQIDCNLGELKSFMDYRGAENGASRWEYYQDKGMSFDDAITAFVRYKTQELANSVIYEPST